MYLFEVLLAYVRYIRGPSVPHWVKFPQRSLTCHQSSLIVLIINEGRVSWAWKRGGLWEPLLNNFTPVDSRSYQRLRDGWGRVSKDLVTHYYVDLSNLSTQTNYVISRLHLLSPAGFWYCVNLVWTSLNRFLNRSISRGERIWTPCLSSSSIFLNTISYFACCSSISSGYKRVRNELWASIWPIKGIIYTHFLNSIYGSVITPTLDT